MSEWSGRSDDSGVAHTEYVRGRFQCAGCGANVPVEKRASA